MRIGDFKTLKVTVTDLDWDTDGEPVKGLPKRHTFRFSKKRLESSGLLKDGTLNKDELEEAITDELTDRWAWCLKGLSFTYEKI